LINSENMLELLEKDPSWATKKAINAGKIPKKSSLENLDEVINIDYSLINISAYSTMKESFSPFAGEMENPKQFFVVTSRGCPFKCAFCIRSSDDDKSIRYASVDKIIEHVEFLVKNYGMNILTFYDDQILLNKKRAKQLFRELAKFNLRIECPNGLSVAFIDDEMAELMKIAGMDTVCLAIESGSPYVLYDIIHKPLRIEMVAPVVQSLRKYGFWIQGYFVSGMPGERDEHREETVRFIKDVELDWAGFSLAVPSRGSELYRNCIKKKYIQNLGIGELETNKYIINTPEYSAEYVERKTYLMNLHVNFVENYRMKRGDYEIATKCFGDVIKRYSGHAFAHYYRAKAFDAMGDIEHAKMDMDSFNEILEKDNIWKEYAKYFNIG
jgi:anaerobic magnesium-protoporphyrin IX monomethyl ester cyclase